MKLTKEESKTVWIGLYNLLSNLENCDGMEKETETILFNLMDRFNFESEKKELEIDLASFIVDKTEYMYEIEQNILIGEIINCEKVKITIDFL